MSDLIHRLRVKVDRLNDRLDELEAERERLLENNARLRVTIERLSADRRRVIRDTSARRGYVSILPCNGCGCHPDMLTPGCRPCSWRHSKRRRRNLELVS